MRSESVHRLMTLTPQFDDAAASCRDVKGAEFIRAAAAAKSR